MASCLRWCAPKEAATCGFVHGVGSFDPLPHAVILWTRVTPPLSLVDKHGPNLQLEVGWELSACPDFSRVVQRGVAVTASARDFTVAVDVTGLEEHTRYFYRFYWADAVSPTGQTQTTAAGPLEEMKLAVVSCANYGFGRFSAYDLATRIDGVDLVVHCGDYIYEYSKGEYPERFQQARHGLRPKGPCRTLDDYRARYACYRRDPDLQRLHQLLPMVAVW